MQEIGFKISPNGGHFALTSMYCWESASGIILCLSNEATRKSTTSDPLSQNDLAAFDIYITSLVLDVTAYIMNELDQPWFG